MKDNAITSRARKANAAQTESPQNGLACRKGVDHQTPAVAGATGLQAPNAESCKGHVLVEKGYASRGELLDQLCADAKMITGTTSALAAERVLHYAANAMVWPRPKDGDSALQALVAMRELAPQNFTEAMLASQMLATNEAALMFIRRATGDSSQEVTDLNVARATRLMSLHLDQIEAMQKLKGLTGQQRVTVEHVTVQSGGQAIVGNIEALKGRQGGGGQ